MFYEKFCRKCGDELCLNISLDPYMFHRILTCNESMLQQINTINKISSSKAPVVILGETGTGKELYAEYIHHVSIRNKKSYAKVNCATIPENLFESEMFGYMPGAFTGALKNGKKGIFEIADRGTLFLDEISEMPMNLQSKLLRIIQENTFVKVGGSTEIQSDVRLIVASNKNLREMVEQNLFRRDLFYRLNVVPIYLLPLRERKEDVLLLTYYFVNQFNISYGSSKRISIKLMDAFLEYDWPGNVRELRNTIERAVLLSDEDLLQNVEILKSTSVTESVFQISESNIDDVAPIRIRASSIGEEHRSLKDIVSEYEIFVIKECIKEEGSLRKAAVALETSPSVLSRKLNRHK